MGPLDPVVLVKGEPAVLRPVLLLIGRLRTTARLGLVVALLLVPGLAVTGLDALLAVRVGGLTASRMAILMIAMTGFLLAVWLAVGVVWRNRRDARQLADGVQTIMSDLPLPDGRDEFGDIGRALAITRARLVAQDAGLRDAQATRQNQGRDNSRRHREAEQQARQFAQQLIEETATALAAELDDVVMEVEAVRGTANTITDRVGAADAVVRVVLTSADEAVEVVQALSSSLQRVAGMTQLIATVADQTKLLALNATIEAARAGAAGRGFSVVADEVKQLAGTTAVSTEEITTTIAVLEREAEAVSVAIAGMAAGIGGVDKATASLRSVAAEQNAVMEHMERRIALARERTQRMRSLEGLMERRTSERLPMTGSAGLTIGGRRQEVQIRDLSLTGIRVQPGVAGGIQPGQTGELLLPIAGLGPLRAEVARDANGDFGLRFVDLSGDDAHLIGGHIETLLI